MVDDEGIRGSSRSIGRIYRRKHALRALFRSFSLVLLLGGYMLYHRFGGSSSGGSLSQRLRVVGGTSMTHLRNSAAVVRREDDIHFSRMLGEGEGEGGKEEEVVPSSQAQEPGCPELEVADPKWFAAFYTVGTLYMFLALAIVCDEFFVPALEEMSSERHLNLSMDVAGATLMAAGGSAPELFTSFVGTFKQSDIGIGTIVGSAVFNVLFVIGMCSLLSKEVLTLTWWPLFRDSTYYAIGLIVLSLLVGVVSAGKVDWWEAAILLVMYLGYVVLMYFNRKLYQKLTGKQLVLPGEGDDDTVTEGNNEAKATDMTEGRTTPLLSNEFLDTSSDPTPPTPSLTSSSSFRCPSTFRAGILKLLIHPESWEQKGGIGIVAKMHGDVNHVFKKVDVNGNGSIDKDELRKLFQELGHDISDEELSDVFLSLDLDRTGIIHKKDFTMWYMKSEERILSKVKPIFEAFDMDKSGTIDRGEIRELLKTLHPKVTESDVDDAMVAMFKSGSAELITYNEFAAWYVDSIMYTNSEAVVEKQIEQEDKGVCDALFPPRGEGCCAWLWYLLVLPLVAVLTFTIPDVRRPNLGKWCYVSFNLSISWIGVFSFFMVDWVEILGNTIGIPSVVMGLTVLAAGTSVPDLFSSVIVARMGQGDMAVSSSIGSNIFDILVGLPLPWLVFTLWPTTPNTVEIKAEGIWQSIAILIGMLVAIIAIVHCQGWKMTRTLGGLMFFLYFAFLTQAILTEYFKNPCFG